MRLRSRASTAALARSRRYLLSTRSMNAERECFDPAKRSTPSSTSFDSVTDVFCFILPSYYHMANFASGAVGYLRSRSAAGREVQKNGSVRQGLTACAIYCIFCINRNDRHDESGQPNAPNERSKRSMMSQTTKNSLTPVAQKFI